MLLANITINGSEYTTGQILFGAYWFIGAIIVVVNIYIQKKKSDWEEYSLGEMLFDFVWWGGLLGIFMPPALLLYLLVNTKVIKKNKTKK